MMPSFRHLHDDEFFALRDEIRDLESKNEFQREEIDQLENCLSAAIETIGRQLRELEAEKKRVEELEQQLKELQEREQQRQENIAKVDQEQRGQRRPEYVKIKRHQKGRRQEDVNGKLEVDSDLGFALSPSEEEMILKAEAEANNDAPFSTPPLKEADVALLEAEFPVDKDKHVRDWLERF